MTVNQFHFKSLPYEVHFGNGQSEKLSALIPEGQHVFVISGKRYKAVYETLKKDIGETKITLFSEVTQHVPVSLVDKALAQYRNSGAKFIVTVGGGSAIGLGKAIALEARAEIIAVPTTYAGSEMTNIYGITGTDGHKTTGRDDRVMPRHVVYDPELTKTLPAKLAVTSAVNAMAHLVEAAYAVEGNPVTYVSSLYGLEQLFQGLQMLAEEGKLSEESNDLLCRAAFLAGKGLCEVPMSLHHKAAHVLGGTFGLEHSHVHTVLLPFVLEFQWTELPGQVQEDLKKTMNHAYPPSAILDVIRKTEAPSTLKEIGFDKSQIPVAVEQMIKKPYANPRELTEEGLNGLLNNAFKGQLTGNK